MTQEDKQLLLKDLCARLPYGVRVYIERSNKTEVATLVNPLNTEIWLYDAGGFVDIEEIKPYLRPMSSMTEEEKKEYNEYLFYGASIGLMSNTESAYELIDWLNKNMFDYRGLIPLGLAIEVTENNNPYEN